MILKRRWKLWPRGDSLCPDDVIPEDKMLRGVMILSVSAWAVSAQAENVDPDVCETTALIVADAQVMRADGNTQNRATRRLKRQYKDLGENYTNDVIPLLAGFVYQQSEDVMDQDLSEVWKQTCLTADLSAILPSE